ncbi:hypothetical protein YC2023_095306 [Brassica napus]
MFIVTSQLLEKLLLLSSLKQDFSLNKFHFVISLVEFVVVVLQLQYVIYPPLSLQNHPCNKDEQC